MSKLSSLEKIASESSVLAQWACSEGDRVLERLAEDLFQQALDLSLDDITIMKVIVELSATKDRLLAQMVAGQDLEHNEYAFIGNLLRDLTDAYKQYIHHSIKANSRLLSLQDDTEEYSPF